MPDISETAAKRKEVCNICEFRNPFISLCEKCGCFVAAKVMIKAAKCPIGKW